MATRFGCCRKVRASCLTCPRFNFMSGMAHYMMGEEGPARLALQKAVDATADFPDKDEARQRLALLAIEVGAGNPGVRTELENYLRKQPNDPAALMRLARSSTAGRSRGSGG